MVIELADGADLVIQAVAGELDATLLDERIPIEGSLGGQVLRSRRAERLADAPGALRFRLAERVGAHTGLLVPLVFRDQAVGVVAAFDRVTGRPRVHRRGRAPHGGVRGQRRDRGRDRPDGRDAGAASAASRPPSSSAAAGRASCTTTACRSSRRVKLRLGALARAKPEDLPDARRPGDRARRREHPGDAQPDHGHAPGVARPARRRDRRSRRSRSAGRRSSGIDASLDVDLRLRGRGRQTTRLAPTIETTIYRVVQEALTNVAKHAGRAAGQRHRRRARRRRRDRGHRRRPRLLR